MSSSSDLQPLSSSHIEVSSSSISEDDSYPTTWVEQSYTGEVSGNIRDERDGQTYSWKRIGNHNWMTKNLNFSTQVNIEDFTSTEVLIPKFCYDDDTANCDQYGGLNKHDLYYDLEKYTSEICPEGWKIPSNLEWHDLTLYTASVSGNTDWSIDKNDDIFWPDLGSDLKNETSWSEGHSNIVGFNALPAGTSSGPWFFSIHKETGWWSYSSDSNFEGWVINSTSDELVKNNYSIAFGFSIRCIQII